MDLKFSALVDDPLQLPDDEIVYRRIDWDLIGGRDACPAGEVANLKGNAFSDYSAARALDLGYPAPCMSVASHRILAEHGRDHTALVEGHTGYGVAGVRVGDLRNLTRLDGSACAQGVMLAPEPHEPWHCVVFALVGGARNKAVKSLVAQRAFWILPLIG